MQANVPKVFVHIGLPKTATTTLQADLFPLCNNKAMLYVGLLQPRLGVQNDLYVEFFQAIETGNCASIRNEIEKHINKGSSLLFSEEIITLSTGISWQDKLKNLSLILLGFNYEIILTVREPVKALFSSYVERFPAYYKENKSFLDVAKNSPEMHIYHYSKLLSELESNFNSEYIFVKKFEDIIKGDVADIFQFLQIENKTLVLSDNNPKKKKGNYYYTEENPSLPDFFRHLAVKYELIKYYPLIKNIISPLVELMRKIKIGSVKVEQPSEIENFELREYLKDETDALSRYGIKY